MTSTIDNLRREVCNVARNLEYMGHDKAVLATADHVHAFWDPRMKQLIFADDHSLLTPIARDAIEKLQAGADPAPQTRATKFGSVGGVDRSDAG
jgi:formate dehydrogenase subunit delta